jgi:hypothetical protein
MAVADSVPVVNSESHAELKRALEDGMLQDELDRMADDEGDLDEETATLALAAIEALEARLSQIEDCV